MKVFGWTPDFISYEITGAEGWVYYNWAIEHEMTAFGPIFKATTAGYVKQEFEALLNGK